MRRTGFATDFAALYVCIFTAALGYNPTKHFGNLFACAFTYGTSAHLTAEPCSNLPRCRVDDFLYQVGSKQQAAVYRSRRGTSQLHCGDCNGLPEADTRKVAASYRRLRHKQSALFAVKVNAAGFAVPERRQIFVKSVFPKRQRDVGKHGVATVFESVGKVFVTVLAVGVLRPTADFTAVYYAHAGRIENVVGSERIWVACLILIQACRRREDFEG